MSLIKTQEELKALMPTSALKNIATYATLIERAEDAHLRPLLGDSLYEYVVENYKNDNDNEGERDTTLLPLCQSIALYTMVADNIGIFAVSFNGGSGVATVSAEGYQPADEKEKKALSADLWHNALRDTDRLLDILEKDARSAKPRYADMWKESEYFYLQGDLLISTAKEALRYVRSSEQPYSRVDFVKQLGDLRFSQMATISMAIGEEWLEWLVRYDRMSPKDRETSKASHPHICTALEYLRQTLMCAARHRRSGKPADEQDANLSLFRAREYMQKHQEEMGEVFKTSPLYHEVNENEDENKSRCRNTKASIYNTGEAAVFTPFPM